MREQFVDFARIADHRLEAGGEDVLHVLERQAALQELRAQAQDVARRQLCNGYVAQLLQT